MLNPTLYGLLQKRFGRGNVKIRAENQEMSCTYSHNPLTGQVSLDIDEPGEEYLISCPFCTDSRGRLTVNHRWAVYDPQTDSKNLWLANCRNEQCLRDYTNQKSLYELVVESNLTGRAADIRLVKPTGTVTQVRTTKMALPGALWRLDDMKIRSPLHKAIWYMEDRLLDAAYVGRVFGVGYCIDSSNEFAKDRIIAPVFMDGKLVGWQARYLGDPPSKEIPRWLTAYGMKCGHYLYNYDEMRKHQTKVVTEGPSSTWGVGKQACGLFTKTMSKEQQKLFVGCFNSPDVCAILLDPAQDEKAKARGDRHHIEVLYDQLNKEPKLRGRVIKVYLPGGKDPAELDREYMQALIRMEARAHNLEVSFDD